MGAKCKKLPGIIREEDKKLDGRAGSSVLQYGTPVAKSSCATKMNGPMYMYSETPANFKLKDADK